MLLTTFLWLIAMPFTRIPMEPGVYLDDSPTEVEGYWVNADKIRFVRGLPQTMAGWELYSTTALNGVCRGLHTWADINGAKWAMAGTHQQLYLLTDGQVYDSTPVISRTSETSLTFTTDGTTQNVTVFWPSHGMTAGQRFALANPEFSTIGGTVVAGTWTVGNNPGTSTLTYAALSTTTSAVTNVSNYSDTAIYLAPGLKDGAAGAGFGTGYWSGSVGAGTTYSTPTTGVSYPRTWDIDNFGQNALACPRGGKIYELAPITSARELTTNGSFSGSASGWTLGTGFTYGTNNVTAASVTNANLQQNIVINPAAYFEAEITLSSVTQGTIFAALGGTTLTNQSASNTTLKMQGWGGKNGGATTLSFSGIGLTATLSAVTVKQLTTAQPIPAAPITNTCMLVTGEKFVMVGGTIEIATGNFNPMHIRWSNIADEQTWAPNTLVPNLSGFYTLGDGSRIVGMKQCGNEVLVWTDTALYAGTYSTDPGIIYSFRLVGTGCGLIGCHASAIIGGIAYWMSPQGTTFTYSGGVPVIIRSTMIQDMMENLAFVQQDKIMAAQIAQYGDIIWIYPDSRDNTQENSRYQLLCTTEGGPNPTMANNVGIYVNGTFTRTAWTDAGTFQYPLAVDANGQIYYQEKGDSANGAPLNWTLQTGDIQLGNGDTAFKVSSLIPDFATLTGGTQVYVVTKLYPQSTPLVHGPFNVTNVSTKVDLLSDAPVGRNASFLFEGMAAPAYMRTGKVMFIEEDTGMVF